MHSEIVMRGCAPSEQYPLVDTVARASNPELAAIEHFWQSQPDTLNVRALALGIIEREIRERTCLDATRVLTAGQQRRVMTFARNAPRAIEAFVRFRVVMDKQTGTAWILFTERQLGRSRTHALMIDAKGMLTDEMDERLAEQLGAQCADIDIIALFAEDGSDTQLLVYFKPALRLAE